MGYESQFVKKLDTKFRDLCNRNVSPVPIGWFRIIFGISVLIEAVNLFYFRSIFFTPDFFLQPDSILTISFFLGWFTASILIIVGFKTRTASVINFILAIIFLGFGASGYGFEWHVDSLILSGSLLLLFMPSDDALSVKSYLRRKNGDLNRPSTSFIYQVLLMLLIGGVYIDSIFWKVTSDMYLNGLALWAPASLPFNVYLDFQWLLNFRFFIYAASVIVLFYEAAFIFLVWFRYWRTLLLVLGIIFHIAIGIIFPLPAFGLIMIGLLMGGLQVSDYAWIYKKIFRNDFRFHYDTDNIQECIEPGDRQNWTAGRALSSVSGMKQNLIAFYLVFWFLSLVIIHFRSPFYITYAGNENGFWRMPYYAGMVYKNWVYPVTGFSTHGLYVDSHFRDYNRQIKLVYKYDDKKKIIPLIRDNGMAGRYNVGRNHIYWTFRTASPSVPRELMEQRLERFIRHWINSQNIKGGYSVYILQNNITVSLDRHIPNLLQENMEREWHIKGSYNYDGEKGRFIWNGVD